MSESPFERMRGYLRAIGQGPRNGRDLNREEAADAMALSLGGGANRAQTGGFLLLQRTKGEWAGGEGGRVGRPTRGWGGVMPNPRTSDRKNDR